MTYEMPLLSADPVVSDRPVTVMKCRAVSRIDPGPIATLFRDLGPDAAEDTICRVLEDIAERLNALHSLRCRAEFDQIPRPANRIRSIAIQIGLIEVATAAEGVGISAQQGDGVALEATLARLERSFDAAISQIWDVQNGA